MLANALPPVTLPIVAAAVTVSVPALPLLFNVPLVVLVRLIVSLLTAPVTVSEPLNVLVVVPS